MSSGKHLDTGAFATGSATYSGLHRAGEMDMGVGFWPMGDRSRDRLIDLGNGNGTGVYEEREPVDKYTKYYSPNRSKR